MKKRKNSQITGPVPGEEDYVMVSARKNSLEKLKKEFTGDPVLVSDMVAVSPEQYIGEKAGIAALSERSSSWAGRYCPYVMVRDIEEVKTGRSETIRKRLESELGLYKDLLEKSDVSSFTSKYAGCPTCGSRVNRAYIKDSSCPVCGKNLRSKSAVEAISKKEEKISRLRLDLERELVKNADSAPLRYLVAIPKRSEQ